MIKRKNPYRIPLDHPVLDKLHKRMHHLVEDGKVGEHTGRLIKEMQRLEQLDCPIVRFTQRAPLPPPTESFKPYHCFGDGTLGEKLQDFSNHIARIGKLVDDVEAIVSGSEDDI